MNKENQFSELVDMCIESLDNNADANEIFKCNYLTSLPKGMDFSKLEKISRKYRTDSLKKLKL
jgi:hypothetical protein